MRYVLRSLAALSLLVVLLPTACGRDATAPADGLLSPLVVSGNGQQGVVGTTLPQLLVIQALDSRGRPMKNLWVEFRVTSGGGTTTPVTVRTNQSGLAQTSWTLGTSTSQPQALDARAVASGAPLGSFTATALPGPAAQLAMQAGDGQTAAHDAALAIAPAVRVGDQFGNPAPGATVTFAVATGGGSVTGATATSNAQGIATVGSWTLGSALGQNTLTATVSGVSPVTFTATATAGAAAHLTLHAGTNQTAPVGTAVPILPAVRITDAAGFPVAGVTPAFAITQGSGQFSTTGTATSNTDGIAAVAQWSLGTTPGTYVLRAAVTGIADTVFFTATAVAGPPATLAVHAGNTQSANAGTAVAIAPAVVVRDAFNNPVAAVSVQFEVTGGGGSVNSTTPATSNQAGVAGVGGWVLGPTPGTNTLTATVPGVDDVTFAATGVAAVVVGTKSSIAFAPLGIVASAGEITTTITVTARDANNNPVAGATATLTATGNGNTLTQPTAVTDATGVTTGALSSTAAGFKTVRATINGSTTFGYTVEVVGGPPASMVAFGGDHQIASPGTPVPFAPQVQVLDQFGNSAYGTAVSWEVTGGGGSVATTETPGVINTIATSGTWTLGPVPGPNTLRATIQGTAFDVTFTATADASFWTSHAPLPTRRFVLSAAALNGLVYAVGGMDFEDMATVEAYDPTTNTWVARAPLPRPRSELAVAVVDNVLYAIGGISNRSVVGTVEAYDPVTDSWTPRSPMPTPRADVGVAVVDGIIYTIGGASATSSSVGTVEAYDPATDTWTTKAAMPTPRLSLGAAEVGGIIYAVGGSNDANFWLATVEAYDPASNTWSVKAPLPTPRFGLGVAAIAGRVYAMGGHTPVGSFSELTDILEAYDPATNTWAAKPRMLGPRVYLATAVLQGLVYAVGGMGSGNLDGLEAYHP